MDKKVNARIAIYMEKETLKCVELVKINDQYYMKTKGNVYRKISKEDLKSKGDFAANIYIRFADRKTGASMAEVLLDDGWTGYDMWCTCLYTDIDKKLEYLKAMYIGCTILATSECMLPIRTNGCPIQYLVSDKDVEEILLSAAME